MKTNYNFVDGSADILDTKCPVCHKEVGLDLYTRFQDCPECGVELFVPEHGTVRVAKDEPAGK